MSSTIENSVSINKSPTDFFDYLKNKTYLGPIVVPEKIKNIVVLQPDGEREQSVMKWEYVLKDGGPLKNSNEKIEKIDESEKSYKSNFSEGDIGSQYKQFYVTWCVIVKTTGNLVKCSISVVKQRDDVPDPNDYLQLYCDLIKGLDNYTPQD